MALKRLVYWCTVAVVGSEEQEFRADCPDVFRFLRFYVFYDNINVKENVFFQSAS